MGWTGDIPPRFFSIGSHPNFVLCSDRIRQNCPRYWCPQRTRCPPPARLTACGQMASPMSSRARYYTQMVACAQSRVHRALDCSHTDHHRSDLHRSRKMQLGSARCHRATRTCHSTQRGALSGLAADLWSSRPGAVLVCVGCSWSRPKKPGLCQSCRYGDRMVWCGCHETKLALCALLPRVRVYRARMN